MFRFMEAPNLCLDEAKHSKLNAKEYYNLIKPMLLLSSLDMKFSSGLHILLVSED